MIFLDTNVISEVLRSDPDSTVKAWMNNQIRGEIGITAITVAQVLYGIKSLPEAKGHNQLLEAAAEVPYAEVVTRRERIVAPISMPDAQIAAINRRLTRLSPRRTQRI